MDVKNAIALMAKNPMVSFPWEGTLIGLVNGFLPEGSSQLDPNTAQAADVVTAIESLESSIQEMVYTSHIAAGPSTYVPPTPAPPALPQPPSLTPSEVNEASVVAMRNTMYKMLGFTICVVAIYMVLNIGNGADSKDIVELLKVAVSLMKDKDAPATE